MFHTFSLFGICDQDNNKKFMTKILFKIKSLLKFYFPSEISTPTIVKGNLIDSHLFTAKLIKRKANANKYKQ